MKNIIDDALALQPPVLFILNVCADTPVALLKRRKEVFGTNGLSTGDSYAAVRNFF
ncbi:hypothetical protein HMPREF9413_1256 [Paenibacillus sp. HGF7]|nr:hypothetical protein HMPREF9413_1256 [Paenibacillus sp. HGF7]